MRFGMPWRVGDNVAIGGDRLGQMPLHGEPGGLIQFLIRQVQAVGRLRASQQGIDRRPRQSALLPASQHQMGLARMAIGDQRLGIGQPVLPHIGARFQRRLELRLGFLVCAARRQ